MSTNHTPNYNLSQWKPEDAVQREDFNCDNQKIDAALAEKAEQSALDALSQTVSGHTASLSQQSSTMAKKGNCQIYTTSYSGNGLYGERYPTSVYFSKKPSIVFILGPGGHRATFAQYMTKTRAISISGLAWDLTVSWSGNTLYWYSTAAADGQMNESGKTYTVIAFMPV